MRLKFLLATSISLYLLSASSCQCRNLSIPKSYVDSVSFISTDTANRMLTSYLNSINYTNNDSDLYSLIMDARSLRLYLSDTSITEVKIMLAHSQEYINAGHINQYAGYKRGALSVIIAGVNANGNYVLRGGSGVTNRVRPCPTNCPQGTASSPTIQ